MPPAPPVDAVRAAEHLRRWLDEMALDPALGAWHRAHAAPLIAAALALEEVAAETSGPDRT